jgi:RHS repeat-associated protein
LVEETAYYPFGGARNEYRPRQIEESYKFIQKERDRESGLHYFEARFLSGLRSRFLSVDPKYANAAASTTDPQQLNLYAYARNNPVLYVDPTGLDWEVAESIEEIDVDLTAKVVGDALGATWVGSAIKAPPKIKDPVSFIGGFGDAIVDPMAQFAGVKTFGLGFGRFTRLAFGINNVDTSSPDYGGGQVISTVLQFAVGAGEVKAALSGIGGAETAVTATKNFSPRAFAKTHEVSPRAFAKTEPFKEAVTGVSEAGHSALSTGAIQANRAQRAALAASNRQVAAFIDQVHAQRQVMIELLRVQGIKPSSLTAPQVNQIMNLAFEQAKSIWKSAGWQLPPGTL